MKTEVNLWADRRDSAVLAMDRLQLRGGRVHAIVAGVSDDSGVRENLFSTRSGMGTIPKDGWYPMKISDG